MTRIIPTLGDTEAQVISAWVGAGSSYCGRRGWLRPFAFNVHTGREYFFDGRGALKCVAGPGLYDDVSKGEEDELYADLANGAVEVYRRGTWSESIDRRWPKQVLHQATGKALGGMSIHLYQPGSFT
jgi:hypothetical protein